MIENYFSPKNGLCLIFFENHFYEKKIKFENNDVAVAVINFQCGSRMYYQSKRLQPEFYICCTAAHGASFGIFPV